MGGTIKKGGKGNGEMRNEKMKKEIVFKWIFNKLKVWTLERSKIKTLHPNQTLGTPKPGTPKANQGTLS